jgi:S1-C subfamily serine protease
MSLEFGGLMTVVKATSAEQLAFEREKWADEVRLRQQELDAKKIEARKNRWISPLAVAVFAAAVAVAGNAVVTLLNGNAQRQSEQVKADQALILEAIKANSPDKAAANLTFLVDTALIADEKRRTELHTFLQRRRLGEGPALPSAVPSDGTIAAPEILNQFGGSIGYLESTGTEANGHIFRDIGTCFIVGSSGYALTVAHVIPETPDLHLTVALGSRSATPRQAAVVKLDREIDLALIKIPGQDYVPVKIAQAQPSAGETVSIVGYAFDLPLSLSIGNVVSLSAGGDLIVGTLASPGESGGPLFNSRGEVVGIVRGQMGLKTAAVPILFSGPLLAMTGSQ